MLMLGWITEGFIGMGIWIVSGIYGVASFTFQIFLLLASGELVSANDYRAVLNNFYLILGIVMLFVLAFALLRGMINPDDQKNGTSAIKKGIINLVISMLLLTVLPTIFSFAFDFQDAVILNNNTIGKLFNFGSVNSSNGRQDVAVAANELVNGVFTAFFNVNSNKCFDEYGIILDSSESLVKCQEQIETNTDDGTNGTINLAQAMVEVKETGNFNLYGQFSKQADESIINFNFILSLLAALILIYVSVSYCFDMAVRLVKLVFYQVIAPIPILLRIIPEGKLSGMFNNWAKVTVTCYLEVFMRLLVFYFCVWLCTVIINSPLLNGTAYQYYGGLVALLAQAFVILGIVMFMRQAPKLFSEVTGIDSGKMKLGIKDKLKEGGLFAAGAVTGGLLTAGIRNATHAASQVQNKYNQSRNQGKGRVSSALSTVGQALHGVGSVVTGAVSGGARSIKAGVSAGSFQDMRSAASKGGRGAVDKRDKRAAYKAIRSSGEAGPIGWLKDKRNVIAGHVKDALKTGYNFATDQSIEGLSRESQSMGQIVSSFSTFNDAIESLLEKEQSKGDGSVFKGHGFNLQFYKAFDESAQRKRDIQAKFQSGQKRLMELRDARGNIMRDSTGNIMYEASEREVTEADLRNIEKEYSDTRDNARDELMNISFAGEKSATYKALDAKAQAAMQPGIVDAEKFQTTLISNSNSQAVQSVMGTYGNGSLGKVLDKNKNLEVSDLVHSVNGKSYKLKDVTNVFKGQVDHKIAELRKEEAAKGEKKQ